MDKSWIVFPVKLRFFLIFRKRRVYRVKVFSVIFRGDKIKQKNHPEISGRF